MKALILFVTVVLFLFLSGCTNFSEKDGISKFDHSDTTSVGGPGNNTAKLVKSAAINIKVKNAEEAAREISNLTQRTGGMVYHQKITSTAENHKDLSLSKDSVLSITVVSP